MSKITGYPKSLITITILITSIILLTQCMEKNDAETVVTKTDFTKYSGSAACANCHKNIYEAHIKTAHFLTSVPPTEKFIKGSFEAGKNVFAFNANASVVMEKRKDGLYQVQYENGIEKKARQFGMVIGSGTKGQSFLHWQDDLLFQMPITYFSAASEWSNSPGFPPKPIFNRVITSRCLECHSTFVETIPGGEKQPDRFDKNRILLGVDCEKCHGPAAEHVNFQTNHPTDSVGKFILNPDNFSRQQKLDLCALCHGGRLQKTKPSFSFTAGEKLSDFFVLDTVTPDPATIDVHGNQFGLMRASACFKKSSDLTCNSCHSSHENEKGNTALFSKRCMNCHNDEHNNFCKLEKTLGSVINTNCIDCHMPVKPSKAISVFLPGQNAPTAAMIRSHFISINPSLTDIMIRELKKRKAQ